MLKQRTQRLRGINDPTSHCSLLINDVCVLSSLFVYLRSFHHHGLISTPLCDGLYGGIVRWAPAQALRSQVCVGVRVFHTRARASMTVACYGAGTLYPLRPKLRLVAHFMNCSQRFHLASTHYRLQFTVLSGLVYCFSH